MNRTLTILLLTTLAAAAAEPEDKLRPSLEAITPDGMLAHIKMLSSDELEGRGPGTKGEDLSISYIADQFKRLGLKPGNPDGTYLQEVFIAGSVPTEIAPLPGEVDESTFVTDEYGDEMPAEEPSPAAKPE